MGTGKVLLTLSQFFYKKNSYPERIPDTGPDPNLDLDLDVPRFLQ